MAVITTQDRITYAGDNVSTVLAVPFEFFLATDLLVTKQLASSGASATLVLNTDYTTAGAGNPAGGSITTTVPIVSGYNYSIILNPTLTQQSNYPSNSPFPSSTLQNDLDRHMQVMQRLQDQIGRSIRAPDADINPGMLLPPAAQRVLMYAAFDANGNFVATAALPGTANTQASLGLALYPRSGAESAAGVVPVNIWYPYGNVMRYGATGNGATIDTAAIQNANAQAAIGSNSSAQVFLPPGNYLTNATINRSGGVYFVGAGAEFTSISATAAFNGNIIASTGTFLSIINRGGVQNLCINGSWGANNANTLSVGVSESFTNRSIHRDVRIHGCFNGYYGIGVWQVDWDNIQIDGAGAQQSFNGFYLDQLLLTLPSGTSNAVNAVNCTVQGIAGTGYRFLNPNGCKMVDCEAENGVNGFWIGTTAAGCYPIEFGQFTGCVCDTNSGIGYLVQQGSNPSPVIYLQFANCWASTHGNLGVYFDGCQYLNWSNGIIGNNAQGGLQLHNSAYCIVANTEFILNNTSNIAGIGDITIAGGSFNKIIGNVSNMANATSVSVLESTGTNSNTISSNTVFQGMTLIGAGTQCYQNQGYNPVGTSAPVAAGASPWTYTASQSPETHYISQSASFNANISKGGRLLGTLTTAQPLAIQLDPGGVYTVNWTTTAPTYVKDIH